MKRLITVLTITFAAGTLLPAAAFAGNKPFCHGTNQVDCRPDPNPAGKDCRKNDDHCGQES